MKPSFLKSPYGYWVDPGANIHPVVQQEEHVGALQRLVPSGWKEIRDMMQEGWVRLALVNWQKTLFVEFLCPLSPSQREAIYWIAKEHGAEPRDQSTGEILEGIEPRSCAENISPSVFGTLINTRLAQRGWSLPDLARALAPRNPAKSLRKLRGLMDGQDSPQMADAVCRTLEIPKEEREAAIKADHEAWLDTVTAYQSRRFKPHLWIEVTRDWFPSLLSVTGPDIYRKVKVPDEWAALEDEDEIIRLVGGFVAAHYESKDRRVSKEQLVSYVYRREFELAYRFSPDGRLLEKVEGRVLAPMHSVRVG